jgi:hypothetical protein
MINNPSAVIPALFMRASMLLVFMISVMAFFVSAHPRYQSRDGTVPTGFPDSFKCLLGLGFVGFIVDYHMISTCRQRHGDCPTDSPAAAGDECCFMVHLLSLITSKKLHDNVANGFVVNCNNTREFGIPHLVISFLATGFDSF